MKIKKIIPLRDVRDIKFNTFFIYIYLYIRQTNRQKAWTTTRRPVSQMDDDLSASDTLPPTPSREPSIDFSFMQVPRHGIFITEITKK